MFFFLYITHIVPSILCLILPSPMVSEKYAPLVFDSSIHKALYEKSGNKSGNFAYKFHSYSFIFQKLLINIKVASVQQNSNTSDKLLLILKLSSQIMQKTPH